MPVEFDLPGCEPCTGLMLGLHQGLPGRVVALEQQHPVGEGGKRIRLEAQLRQRLAVHGPGFDQRLSGLLDRGIRYVAAFARVFEIGQRLALRLLPLRQHALGLGDVGVAPMQQRQVFAPGADGGA